MEELDMKKKPVNSNRGLMVLAKGLSTVFVIVLLGVGSLKNVAIGADVGSNKQPLSFGKDQTIIDLSRVVWEPLKGEGIPPGPEIATLHGDLAAGGGEALVRLPANYTFPNHSHTSDELYVWIKGNFTYIAEDGTATDLSGQSYINLPGGVPHALRCGNEPCIFYLRYSKPFDYKIHPMPTKK
jgi:quercetin dioxygenase-like cupin family protein